MILVKAVLTECDECGMSMDKAHRNYKGHRYCVTCYARVFKLLACPKCGCISRLPKNIHGAICHKCEINKPCVRCGKEEYKVSKITLYGPVCGSCSVYFRKVRTCFLCGARSRTLSKVTRLGIDVPVCRKCATRDHGTCSLCNKHRLLIKSDDGRLLCKKCRYEGEIKCGVCGKTMSAGSGRRCNDCYWQELFKKRIEISRNAFSTRKMEMYYVSFCEWLAKRLGERKASIIMHKYIHIYMEMERRWEMIPEYTVLVKAFSASELRKVWLSIKWMEEENVIIITDSIKEVCAEKRRIEDLLSRFSGSTREYKLIIGYYEILISKLNKKKTSVRSVRLALSPAVKLMEISKKHSQFPPNKKMLRRYLMESPGQRSAVTGFVNYISSTYDIDIGLTTRFENSVSKNKKLELEFIKLIKKNKNKHVPEHKLLLMALMYFHGVSKLIAKEIIENNDIKIENGREEKYIWNDEEYWLPVLF